MPVNKVQLVWEGKQQAIEDYNAYNYSNYELKENRDKSINFDDTNNIIIEGDNLPVLSILKEKYAGKVKMIYIDPPYNTGKKMAYNDKFWSRRECKHSKWLSMMYPRLKLARELLRDDGVIFVSIDDHEQANLKLLMDEVFGEDNFVVKIVVESTLTQGMKVASAQKGTTIVKNCEYIFIYIKTDLGKNFRPLYTKRKYDSHYSIYFKDGTRVSLLTFLNSDAEFMKLKSQYNIKKFHIEKLYIEQNWFQEYIHNISDNIYRDAELEIKIDAITKNNLISGSIKKFQKYLIFKNANNKIRQLLPLSKAIGNTDDFNPHYGFRSIKGNLWKDFYNDMMNIDREGSIKFKNGKKPLRLVKHMLQISTNSNDIILDFFAGSGTTGHAVVQMNLEDKKKAIEKGEDPELVGNRKYIMVQLPEAIDEKSDAYKAGYKKISDITIERVKRAGRKIKEELDNTDIEIDLSFKVFELTETNFKNEEEDGLKEKQLELWSEYT